MSSDKRLVALDVFRGATIAFMILVNSPGSWSHVFAPLLHAEWHGCTPTDLVFPNFVFIVGVSMAYSLARFDYRATPAAFKKIARRTLLIFGIGLALNWFPFYTTHFSELRIYGVLQRIALAYGLAASLCLLIPRRHWPTCTAALMLVYWGVLYIEGSADPYSLTGNLVRAVDLATVGGDHMYAGFDVIFDPEGLVGMLGTAATALLGATIGLRVRSQTDHAALVRELFVIGSGLLALGLFWNYVLPINKPLWTSSYVAFTGGIAVLSLALLVEFIDVRRKRNWTRPFIVFGTNPLIVFVASGVLIRILLKVLQFENAYGYTTNAGEWLVGIFDAIIPYPKVSSLFFALTIVAACYALAKFLHNRKIFIKV